MRELPSAVDYKRQREQNRLTLVFPIMSNVGLWWLMWNCTGIEREIWISEVLMCVTPLLPCFQKHLIPQVLRHKCWIFINNLWKISGKIVLEKYLSSPWHINILFKSYISSCLEISKDHWYFPYHLICFHFTNWELKGKWVLIGLITIACLPVYSLGYRIIVKN